MRSPEVAGSRAAYARVVTRAREGREDALAAEALAADDALGQALLVVRRARVDTRGQQVARALRARAQARVVVVAARGEAERRLV